MKIQIPLRLLIKIVAYLARIDKYDSKVLIEEIQMVIRLKGESDETTNTI